MKGIENVGRLAPAVLMIVSAYVWNMIARPRKTLAWVVYDECWKLLMNDTAAALQAELYRTARKLRAGVVSVDAEARGLPRRAGEPGHPLQHHDDVPPEAQGRAPGGEPISSA